MDINLFNTTLDNTIRDMHTAGIPVTRERVSQAVVIARSVAMGLLSLDDC